MMQQGSNSLGSRDLDRLRKLVNSSGPFKTEKDMPLLEESPPRRDDFTGGMTSNNSADGEEAFPVTPEGDGHEEPSPTGKNSPFQGFLKLFSPPQNKGEKGEQEMLEESCHGIQSFFSPSAKQTRPPSPANPVSSRFVTSAETVMKDPINEMINLFSPPPLVSQNVASPHNVESQQCIVEPQQCIDTSALEETATEGGPFQEISNFFSPPARTDRGSRSSTKNSSHDMSLTVSSDDEDESSPGGLEGESLLMTPGCNESENEEPSPPQTNNSFDPFKDIRENVFNLLSPQAKQATKQLTPESAWNRQNSSKRLNFETILEEEPAIVSEQSPPIGAREVATLKEIYTDGRAAFTRFLSSATNVKEQDLLDRIRRMQSPLKRSVKEAQIQATIFLDAAKDVEPKDVAKQVQESLKEAAIKIQRNAEAQPLSWAIIGLLALAIFVQVFLFGNSVGTPSMQYWRFTMNVHQTIPLKTTPRIVERVNTLLQNEVGGDYEGFKPATCATLSGEDILRRLAASMHEPIDNGPDLIDLINHRVIEGVAVIRQNPKMLVHVPINFLNSIWSKARVIQMDTFDEATVL